MAARLTELLGKECKMAPDCVGDEVAKIADGLGDGDVMLLENVRFYPAETKNDAGEMDKHVSNVKQKSTCTSSWIIACV